MKNVVIGLVLSFVCTAASAANVFVFDAEQAIFKLDVTQKKLTEMQNSDQFKQFAEQGESLKSDLQALIEEAKKDSLTWSDEQKQEKSKQKAEIEQKLQFAYKQVEASRNAIMGAIARQLQPKMEEILNNLTDEKKIDLILRKQAAVFSKANSDLTGEVVARLNKIIKEAEAKVAK